MGNAKIAQEVCEAVCGHPCPARAGTPCRFCHFVKMALDVKDELTDELQRKLVDACLQYHIGEHDMVRCRICDAEAHNGIFGDMYGIRHKPNCAYAAFRRRLLSDESPPPKERTVCPAKFHGCTCTRWAHEDGHHVDELTRVSWWSGLDLGKVNLYNQSTGGE